MNILIPLNPNFVQMDILMPFNGSPFNERNPNSVVVLDNATIHHINGVKSMIEELELSYYSYPLITTQLKKEKV